MIGAAVCAVPARASSVVPMTIQTLADHAGQVVVGRVSSVHSYWAEAPRRIESEVTLANVTPLKGALADATSAFTFTVPGGAIDGFEMRIGCGPVFAVGDEWLLFLLPTYKTFPVVGLSNGAMRITAGADGVKRVYHPTGAAITGFDAQGFLKVGEAVSARSGDYLQGADSARIPGESGRAAAEQAIPLADFVTALGPILASSKDHALTAAAGRRANVEARAVPLRGIAARGASATTLLRGRNAVRPALRAAVRPAQEIDK